MRHAVLILTLALLGALSPTRSALLKAETHSPNVSRRSAANPPVDERSAHFASSGPAANAVAWSNRAPDETKKIPPPSSGDANRSTKSPSPWTAFAALAVVIPIILVTARLWKKLGPLSHGAVPLEAVEMLGRKNIDQRQAIHLVRLGSRILVLGSSPAGLRTLAEITDPVEVDFLAGLCQRKNGEGGTSSSFRALFKQHAPQPSATAAATATITAPPPRSRAQHDLEQRLRRPEESPRDANRERIHG